MKPWCVTIQMKATRIEQFFHEVLLTTLQGGYSNSVKPWCATIEMIAICSNCSFTYCSNVDVGHSYTCRDYLRDTNGGTALNTLKQ